jgi:DNA-directed RNA polymerase specialized sigma24 family protein
MSLDESFSQLMGAYEAGNEEAAEKLFEQIQGPLLAMAAGLIGDWLRPHYDQDDAVNSALRSVFIGIRERKFEYRGRNALYGLAVTKLRFKILHAAERFRRDQDHLDVDFAALTPQAIAEDVGRELRDVIGHVLEKQSDRDAQMYRLWCEGYKHYEIADRHSVSRCTVTRIVNRINGHIAEEMRSDEDGPPAT